MSTPSQNNGGKATNNNKDKGGRISQVTRSQKAGLQVSIHNHSHLCRLYLMKWHSFPLDVYTDI